MQNILCLLIFKLVLIYNMNISIYNVILWDQETETQEIILKCIFHEKQIVTVWSGFNGPSIMSSDESFGVSGVEILDLIISDCLMSSYAEWDGWVMRYGESLT
jgi:hypothetical protein